MVKKYHILILALLLTSCTSLLGHIVKLHDIETVPGQEALVFGRVKVVENGESLENWDSSLFSVSSFKIHILPEASPEPVSYFYYLTENGSFYWPLSAGGYTITDFTWTVFIRIIRSDQRVIFAQFVVPEETPLVYIGTLIIHLEEGRHTMGIEDEYDQALQVVKQRFPEISGPVTKRLMQLKERR